MPKTKKMIHIGPEVDRLVHTCGRFGESYDDVFRRLLLKVPSGDPSEPKPSVPVKPSKARPRRTPLLVGTPRWIGSRAEYKRVIVRLLGEAGGQLPCRELTAIVRDQYDFSLHERGLVDNGMKVRWVKNLDWARQHLCWDGLLHPPGVSGRGTWKLTMLGLVTYQTAERLA